MFTFDSSQYLISNIPQKMMKIINIVILPSDKYLVYSAIRLVTMAVRQLLEILFKST